MRSFLIIFLLFSAVIDPFVDGAFTEAGAMELQISSFEDSHSQISDGKDFERAHSNCPMGCAEDAQGHTCHFGHCGVLNVTSHFSWITLPSLYLSSLKQHSPFDFVSRLKRPPKINS